MTTHLYQGEPMTRKSANAALITMGLLAFYAWVYFITHV